MSDHVRICALTRYGRLGASSRLRLLQYLPVLREHGIEVDVHPFFTDAQLSSRYASGGHGRRAAADSYVRRYRDMRASAGHDLLWVEYETLPWLPYLAELIALRGVPPLVLDYDDAVFHRYDRHPSRLVRGFFGTKIARLIGRSALTIVGNSYLEEYAVRAGAKRIRRLPTVIDLARYPNPDESRAEAVEDWARLTVGWIGSPATQHYLNEVSSILQEFSGAIRVVLIGARDVQIPGVEVVCLPWSEATEVESLRRIDVGIMPLPDTPWERGKCGYKLIQYMGCGKPVIASAVGVNTEIVVEGVTGFLASEASAWRDAITTLLRDRRRGERMGRAGRARVEEHYSLQVTGPALARTLRDIAGVDGESRRGS